MVGGILLLGIAIFGLLIMFGKARAEQFYKFIIFLILGPVLLGVGINHVLWFWYGMPLWSQILSILLAPFLLSALLQLLLPKAAWLGRLQAVLFESFVYAAAFPFRLLWRSVKFAFNQERQQTKLNPNRPVVGGRPPMRTEGEKRDRDNKLFD